MPRPRGGRGHGEGLPPSHEYSGCSQDLWLGWSLALPRQNLDELNEVPMSSFQPAEPRLPPRRGSDGAV
jgi:hypothetical protein